MQKTSNKFFKTLIKLEKNNNPFLSNNEILSAILFNSSKNTFIKEFIKNWYSLSSLLDFESYIKANKNRIKIVCKNKIKGKTLDFMLNMDLNLNQLFDLLVVVTASEGRIDDDISYAIFNKIKEV